MKVHELKIKAKYYSEICKGIKTFELRKNDRDYQVGDIIHFTVIPDETTTEETCEGLNTYPNLVRIIYILQDVPEYGLKEGYCILAIKIASISSGVKVGK